MDFFVNNISKYQKEDKRLSKLFNQISTIRIVTFISFLMLAIYVADIPNAKALAGVIIALLVSFIVLVKWHNRVKYARNHARFLKQINEDEVKRIEGDLSTFDSGEEFKSDEHYYANDLDVFGRNSLFQLLNRCATITGRNMLANWLLKPASKESITTRQQATIELRETPDFCQNFQAVGQHFEDKKVKFEPLIEWLEEPIVVRSNKWLVGASYVFPIISIALSIGIIWFGVPIGTLPLVLIINGVLLKRVFQYSQKITDQTSQGVSTLSAIAQLIKEVEKTQFSSALLEEIKKNFSKDGTLASKRIESLAGILDFLNSRGNMFYMTFNFLLLLDIHLISRAEKWKSTNREDIKAWFHGISQFEVLASFARFSYANPSFTIPEIIEEDYKFNATNMSHPLIKSNERVGNNFEAENMGTVIIITGSNMSGKSTFLRTVGVNIVLALAGAPVCAEKISLSRMLVFTGMRTQDNLEEHISSFYAELKRIKQLLTLVEENQAPVLFMLDEILKGTNSHDRHKGAVAIVKQLHKTNSFGFISTHDIELGKKGEDFDYCKNYSFSSDVIENEIIFDYKMKKGVCQSFNASALMKNIGIEIE